MARRDKGAWLPTSCDCGATKPAGRLLNNPSGGPAFARGLRWLDRHSPLRGCSDLAALATAKIPRRGVIQNFQTGSQPLWLLVSPLFNEDEEPSQPTGTDKGPLIAGPFLHVSWPQRLSPLASIPALSRLTGAKVRPDTGPVWMNPGIGPSPPRRAGR